MHYYFDDRCVVEYRLMHNHGVRHVSLERNAACEPLEYAIFIDFKKSKLKKVDGCTKVGDHFHRNRDNCKQS